MTETEFNLKVEGVLSGIERSIERSDADIDFEFREGILELMFLDGSKIVINRQVSTREIWVAARSGGYHFAWMGEAWLGTRDRRELFELLSECASQQSGARIVISQ